MIAQVFLAEGSNVLVPFISGIEKPAVLLFNLVGDSFPSCSPAGRVRGTNSEFCQAWTHKERLTRPGSVLLVLPCPLWPQSDDPDYNHSPLFSYKGTGYLRGIIMRKSDHWFQIANY